jgi:hypothetical protein
MRQAGAQGRPDANMKGNGTYTVQMERQYRKVSTNRSAGSGSKGV